MSEEFDTVAEAMDRERDESIRWYAATHSPEYDETIQKKANAILDDFAAAQQDPTRLKQLIPSLDADYDRMNYARGVIWAFMEVLKWKYRAEEHYEEMKQQDQDLLQEQQAEDVGPSYDDQWAANR